MLLSACQVLRPKCDVMPRTLPPIGISVLMVSAPLYGTQACVTSRTWLASFPHGASAWETEERVKVPPNGEISEPTLCGSWL